MIFVDGEVIKIKGKEEDFLAEGCAMIGTILTMVEVKYGKDPTAFRALPLWR